MPSAKKSRKGPKKGKKKKGKFLCSSLHVQVFFLALCIAIVEFVVCLNCTSDFFQRTLQVSGNVAETGPWCRL